MGYNPLVGLLYHWIGGLASATCYLPCRRLKKWAWEVYWLVQGVASWLIAPLLIGLIVIPDGLLLLRTTTLHTVSLVYKWGALWGFGALTFGLSVCYLGVAFGYVITLGLCTAFGTLMPPLFSGELGVIIFTVSGKVILLGVATCVAGIALSGVAGVMREHELDDTEKKAIAKDFNFGRGVAVAVFFGVMSSCFAYGIASGKLLTAATRLVLLSHGKLDLWQGVPALTLVMLGGFSTNIIWCFYMLFRNCTISELWGNDKASEAKENNGGAQTVPLLRNYVLSIGGGILWYFQYFFYTMVKREWETMSFQVSRCIWRASLFSLHDGVFHSKSGKGPASEPMQCSI
jgi:L-rhamnose-H+ transport protein